MAFLESGHPLPLVRVCQPALAGGLIHGAGGFSPGLLSAESVLAWNVSMQRWHD